MEFVQKKYILCHSFEEASMLMEKLLNGGLPNGFILSDSNSVFRFQELYQLLDEDRDERFHVDRIKEP